MLQFFWRPEELPTPPLPPPPGCAHVTHSTGYKPEPDPPLPYPRPSIGMVFFWLGKALALAWASHVVNTKHLGAHCKAGRGDWRESQGGREGIQQLAQPLYALTVGGIVRSSLLSNYRSLTPDHTAALHLHCYLLPLQGQLRLRRRARVQGDPLDRARICPVEAMPGHTTAPLPPLPEGLHVRGQRGDVRQGLAVLQD